MDLICTGVVVVVGWHHYHIVLGADHHVVSEDFDKELIREVEQADAL